MEEYIKKVAKVTSIDSLLSFEISIIVYTTLPFP